MTGCADPVAAPGAPPPPAGRTVPIRLLVVDDHALVREGTVQLLDQQADMEVVGQVGTAEEALRLVGPLAPDVALVDVNLPGMDGLAFARLLATRHPAVRILMVSAYDEYAYVTEALDVGVGGYLLKTASARELIDSVRAVVDGTLVLDRAVSDRLARRARGPALDGATPALTHRELDVLVLLAQGRSNKQIARELSLGVRTVEGYVSNILAKLGVASRTEAALHALQHHLVISTHDAGPRPPD